MNDWHQALVEIHAIRNQVARATLFRGYGPASIAASGVLAFIVAAVQTLWLKESVHDLNLFLAIWVATAIVAALFATIETIGRAQRVHSGFAREMISSAVEQFLPALATGLLLTMVLARVAPQDAWMLPGLWELIFGLGVFASCRFLPRQMFGVGVWYLAAGLACLAIESGKQTLAPWAMGIPFGVGQLLVAAVLRFGFAEASEEK